MPQEMRDLIIIGTGPAGLAAALTAQNRGLDFEIFGQADLSAKIAKAPKVHNFLGLPDVSGRDLAAALQKQAEAAGIKIRPERIGAVYSMGDSLSVQVGQDFESARAVILASGLAAVKAIPGEDELTGQGVSTCATCDGMLYKGRPVIAISDSRAEESEVAFLASVCSSVEYIPLYKDNPRGDDAESGGAGTGLPKSIKIIRENPIEISKSGNKIIVTTEEGVHEGDCVFVLRESVAPSKLVPGLASSGGAVTVDRQMATNIPGLFAAGDVTGAPYQYMKSAGEGTVAAISAAKYVSRFNRRK